MLLLNACALYLAGLVLFTLDVGRLRTRLGIPIWLVPGYAVAAFVLIFGPLLGGPDTQAEVNLALRVLSLTAALNICIKLQSRIRYLRLHPWASLLAVLVIPVMVERLAMLAVDPIFPP